MKRILNIKTLNNKLQNTTSLVGSINVQQFTPNQLKLKQELKNHLTDIVNIYKSGKPDLKKIEVIDWKIYTIDVKISTLGLKVVYVSSDDTKGKIYLVSGLSVGSRRERAIEVVREHLALEKGLYVQKLTNPVYRTEIEFKQYANKMEQEGLNIYKYVEVI